MGVTNFPNGISSFGIPMVGSGPTIPATTGSYFFVDSSTGSNSNPGTSKERPLATITYAISLCTASKGDVILVMPGHAETVTAAITVDKAGVYILGLGWGNLRPTITGSGTIDAVNITAANVVLDNIRFAAPAVDAQTADVNVAAAGVTLRNLEIIGSTTSNNVVDCITIASGANDLTIDGVTIYNTVVAVNSFVSIEAAVARLKIFNSFFFGDCVTAGIIDGAAATQIHFNNVTVGTIGTTIPAVILDSNPTGVVENFVALGTHTTLASNANWGNVLRLKGIWTLEETDASAQATNVIPALDVN